MVNVLQFFQCICIHWLLLMLVLLIFVLLGQKDHYFVDMADDVVRGSIVTHEV
jgi:hypothetical protein